MLNASQYKLLKFRNVLLQKKALLFNIELGGRGITLSVVLVSMYSRCISLRITSNLYPVTILVRLKLIPSQQIYDICNIIRKKISKSYVVSLWAIVAHIPILPCGPGGM